MNRRERVDETGCTAMRIHNDDREAAIAFLEKDKDRVKKAWEEETNPDKAKKLMAQEKEIGEAISSLNAGNYGLEWRLRDEDNALKLFRKRQAAGAR